MRLTGMLGLVLLACLAGVRAHVHMNYPPATLRNDFLDNLRSAGICGHDPSGSDLSDYWRLSKPDLEGVTELEAGSTVTVSWDLHYAHQGGFRFELYDSDLNMVSTWNDSTHWGCDHDGTQQEVELVLPTKTCEGCILRLQRQALEWGAGYLFHSCSMVDIVEKSSDDAKCNGCSGHGTCKKGKCECDSSLEDGFWYGQYCQYQNECEEDAHCGEEGLCIDIEATTAPTKQCYCKKGFFGPEVVRGSTTADLLSTRDCSVESQLELGDPEDWEEEYPNKLQGGETMTVYYKVDEEKEEIEFAVAAKTKSWLAFGIRAAGDKKNAGKEKKSKKDKEDEDEVDGDGEGAAEGEPRGSRRLTATMPSLDSEALEMHRILLADEKKTGNKKGKKGDEEEYDDEEKEDDAEVEGEPNAEVEGEPTGEGDGGNTLGCPAGKPKKVKRDEGVHFDKPIDEGASLGAAKGKGKGKVEDEKKADGEKAEAEVEVEEEVTEGKGRRLLSMPGLDTEMPDSIAKPRRSLMQSKKGKEKKEKETDDEEEKADGEGEGEPIAKKDDDHEHDHEHDDEEEWADGEGEGEPKPKKNDKKKHDDDEYEDEKEGADGEGEGEAEAEGESAPAKKIVKTYFAEGTDCENLLVEEAQAHPMINQDIIVAYARGDAIRVQDTFTPSRARPIPDVFFGGSDDILDAVGEETEDGETFVKIRKKLQPKDQGGDYCILKDITYLGIYAIGQEGELTHIPDSSLETGRASNKKFYGEDELKFHGGGIGTSFAGRGSFGLVDFFAEAKDDSEGCTESTIEDFECMSSELGGELELHWKQEDDGVLFGAKSTGSGWVSVAFPETPGVMIGADAVIGFGDGEVDVFKLEAKASSGIVAGNDAFEITEAGFVTTDGSLLTFKREFDDSFTADSKVDLLVAFNADSAEGFLYHGPNRAGTTIDLSL